MMPATKPNNHRNDKKSMINNLMLLTNGLEDAPKAKFFLKRLAALSGERQQSILVKSVLYSAKNNSRYAEFHSRIEKEWEQVHAAEQ